MQKLKDNTCLNKKTIFKIECVQANIYLGQKIGANPDHVKEIKIRTEMGWNALGRSHNVMKSNIPLSLKRKVYNQRILLVRMTPGF